MHDRPCNRLDLSGMAAAMLRAIHVTRVRVNAVVSQVVGICVDSDA